MVEVKSVVFVEDELEYWGNSILTEFLPLFINEDFKSDVTDNIHEF